jgi:hypothetical protein
MNRILRGAILPDLAAFWVASGYRNPLPIDWGEDHELNTPALRDRVYQSIVARRPDIVVLVQKVAADQLAVGFVPVDNYSSYSKVTEKVRNTLDRVGETTYFELYK